MTGNCYVFSQIVQVDWFNLALIWSVSLQIDPSSLRNLVWVMVLWSNELGDFQNSPSRHLQKWHEILVHVYCAVSSSIFFVPIDRQLKYCLKHFTCVNCFMLAHDFIEPFLILIISNTVLIIQHENTCVWKVL